MTKRHIIILISFLLTLCGAKVSAQNEFLLTGKIMDNDMNPVELASVSCLSQGKSYLSRFCCGEILHDRL